MLGPLCQNQYTAHESCKLIQWVRSEWSSHSALLIWTADVSLLSDTGTGVLWPCSKPVGALLPRGPLAYDIFLHSAQSHYLSVFSTGHSSSSPCLWSLTQSWSAALSTAFCSPWCSNQAQPTFPTLTGGACTSKKPTKLYCPSAPSINLPPLRYPENVHWDQDNQSSSTSSASNISFPVLPCLYTLLYSMF